MFEHFNDAARKAVVLAQEYARMLDHDTVTPEHLLLASIHHADSAAAVHLTELGVDVDALRERVKTVIGRGQHRTAGHIVFTETSRQVLLDADRACAAAGRRWLGDLQILGALTSVSTGPLPLILDDFGVGTIDVADRDAAAPTRGYVLAG